MPQLDVLASSLQIREFHKSYNTFAIDIFDFERNIGCGNQKIENFLKIESKQQRN